MPATTPSESDAVARWGALLQTTKPTPLGPAFCLAAGACFALFRQFGKELR